MMTFISPSSSFSRRLWLVGSAVAAAVLLAIGVQILWAQVAGERGIAPVATSSDIVTSGIKVDVIGDDLDDAREKAWREAHRKAWAQLGGAQISDSQLQGMVSAVVIEEEKLGGRRYVGTLGVIFDRARAGAYLSGAGGARSHSAPMLTIPVMNAGGSYTVFETRNAWQRVWAEYQAGSSAIDYVRPSGAGADSLVLNYGQIGRHSRTWWRNILDEFGAADVITPIVRLERQWPGGPVIGHFTARYGPDSHHLGSFSLRVENEDAVDAMLVEGRGRLNTIFSRALADGVLRPDPTLRSDRVAMDPAIEALIAAGRVVEQTSQTQTGQAAGETIAADPEAGPPAPQPAMTIVVQFASPDAASVDGALSAVRSVAGVRGAATSSIAIGGTSVMRVTFTGGIEGLAQGLRARGWQVVQGSNALSISR